MSRVSFILPAFKRRFLKKAIDSILAQTCRDFKLVLVDDKSSENLYEVIQGYRREPSLEALSTGGRKGMVEDISIRYNQNGGLPCGMRRLIMLGRHYVLNA